MIPIFNFNKPLGSTKTENRYEFTPYEQNVDESLKYLDDFDSILPYRMALMTVIEYVEFLESKLFEGEE